MKFIIKTAFFTCLMVISSMSCAGKFWVRDVTVTKILIDSDFYGGCMIQVSKLINTTGADCPGNWVTLDCKAQLEGSTKSDAANKLSLGQLSMLAGNTLNVRVDDARKINGYCYAQRIDIKS